MSVDTLANINTFLESQRLRHIAHLKYLYYYPDDVNAIYVDTDGDTGILMDYPVSLIGSDQDFYPEANHIFLPIATSEKMAHRLVEHMRAALPNGQHVVKFCDALTRTAFTHAFQLIHARTLISYMTNSFQAPESVRAMVKVGDQLEPELADLYDRNGYTQSELEHHFADGAHTFTIYEDGQAVCSCIAYRNFGDVWEVGALHTLPHARRKGYARRVVSVALEHILAAGHTPRYVAENDNNASIQLAESFGLQPFLHFEHWLLPASPQESS